MNMVLLLVNKSKKITDFYGFCLRYLDSIYDLRDMKASGKEIIFFKYCKTSHCEHLIM